MRNVVSKMKRPEYTGDNRCVPCTVVNVLVAVAVSAGLVAIGAWMDALSMAVGVGVGVLVVSCGTIYLRGYLVPGTPTLTREYFPPWLLRLFGKRSSVTVDVASAGEIDPREVLTAAGVLESADGSLRLAERFRVEWSRAIDEMGEIDDDVLREAYWESEAIEVDEWDVFRVYDGAQLIGKWRSRAAFVADLATARVLSDRIRNWSRFSVQERARLLAFLRRHLSECPACGGAVERGTETIRGCCGGTHEATTVSCADCDARLYLEICPECGEPTELTTETADAPEGARELATISCVDCGERVDTIPPL